MSGSIVVSYRDGFNKTDNLKDFMTVYKEVWWVD